jgi:DNA-binding NtrC family response regulator
MSQGTTLAKTIPGMPVRTLRIDVTEGPDAGVSHTSQGDRVSLGTAASNEVVLTDPTVSRFHAELVRAPGGVRLVDHGSTNGTFVGVARVERAVVPAGTSLRVGATVLRVSDGEDVLVPLHGDELGGLRGRSKSTRRLMATIEGVARSNAAVLAIGESGTGKELVAQSIHELSSRTDAPLVTVDCGALSPNLVSSELFGHERGAFTGADRQHVGAFERARGGTLFLDEIGEIPLEMQPTLLGVLERKTFRRIGGKTDLPMDARIVSATNRDLRDEVNAGRFRLDLYYRVAVVTLHIAPLRERPEDVPVLVEHFLRQCGHAGPVSEIFDAEALASLTRHPWPGNARELRNFVEATLAMGELPPFDGGSGRGNAASGGTGGGGDLIAGLLGLSYKEARTRLLWEFEERYLKERLEQAGGNVSQAARQTGLDRTHLITLLQRHELRRGR